MTTDANQEKEQNEFSQKEANKSFAYSILMNLSTMCKLEFGDMNHLFYLICHFPWVFVSLFAGRSYTKSFDSILEDYGAYEIIDFVIQHLTKHPFIAFGMLICVLSCALPFIIFMVFAIATVVMTFTGFVIIEGQSISLLLVLILQSTIFASIKLTEIVQFFYRHIDNHSIGSTFWISWCCDNILFVFWFCNVGRLFWFGTSL